MFEDVFCWAGEIWRVEIWRTGVVNLVDLACAFRATTKKSSAFLGKSAPLRRENPGYAYMYVRQANLSHCK